MIIQLTEENRKEISAATKSLREEEKKLKEQLLNLSDDHFTIADGIRKPQSKEAIDLAKQINDCTKRTWKAIRNTYEIIENRYYEKIGTSQQSILNDAYNQTDTILEYMVMAVDLLGKPDTEKPSWEIYKKLEPIHSLIFGTGIADRIRITKGDVTKLNAQQIIHLIQRELDRHYEMLDAQNKDTLAEYVKKAVLEALKKTPDHTITLPPFFKMYHDNFMDILPLISSRTMEEDAKGNYYITVNRTKVSVSDTEGLIMALGVPTHKLLSAALELVTENQKHNTVYISTKDYFKSIGYDISDPEVFKKNITRTNQYLLTMQRMIVSEAKEKKRRKKITNINIVTKTSIDNDFITIQFHPEYVSYLINRKTIMQYPRALFGIDARSANTYRIGYKMATHSSMDPNIIRGSHNTLEVETIYEVTDLPTIDVVRKQRNSWTRSIRDPFEAALNALVKADIITKWYYCKPKGKRMTPQERETARSKYETWSRSYIHFEMKDAPDRKEAIEKKKQAEKQAEHV